MDPFNNYNKIASSSVYGGGAESSGHTGTEILNDQTYLSMPRNSTVGAGYFDSVRLHCATVAECNKNSNHTGHVERDANANHPHHPGHNEPCPNEGCGCTGSYNGGAGAGTAECGCECRPYEPGFNDKKRDACCSCQPDDTYQRGLVNKKPECSADYKYEPAAPGIPKFCPPSDNTCCGPSTCGPAPKTSSHCPCEDTYQKDLCCKKPECSVEYKYVPEMPPPKPYCERNDPSCCAKCTMGPDTYELIANTDARKYKGHSPDRSNFYADDGCGCPKRNGSCNNSYAIMENPSPRPSPNWSELRKSYYSVPTDCASCPCRSPSPIRRRSEFGAVDDFEPTKWENEGDNTIFASSSRQHLRHSSPSSSPLIIFGRSELVDRDVVKKDDEVIESHFGRCCVS